MCPAQPEFTPPFTAPPCAIGIAGPQYRGLALFQHIDRAVTASGAETTRRSAFADLLYRYRFGGESSLLSPVARAFAAGAGSLFPGEPFDGVLMPPPPVDRPDYAGAIRLVTEISRLTGLPTLQHAAIRLDDGADRRAPRFGLAAAAVAPLLKGRHVLVITDMVRSGATLGAFCGFLRQTAGVSDLQVLAGTAMPRRGST